MGLICLNIIEHDTASLLLTAAPEKRVTIGRATDNDVVVLDNQCSRYHAEIFWRAGETWALRDLGSSNGTIVDGRDLASAETDLDDGDRIRIGQTVLVFAYGETLSPRRTRTPKDQPLADAGGSGVFGVSVASHPAPVAEVDVVDTGEQTLIYQQRAGSSFLPSRTRGVVRSSLVQTRSGCGSVELCQIAFSLGSAESIEEVGRLALQGLFTASQAESGGLWLVAYHRGTVITPENLASHLRLVVDLVAATAAPASTAHANHAPAEVAYLPLSKPLAAVAVRERQGLLLAENETGDGPPRPAAILVAPIVSGTEFLGVLHLNAPRHGERFDSLDLDYALAVAETVASAVKTIHRTQELAAHLVQARQDASTLRGMLQDDSSIVGVSEPMRQIQHQIRRAAEGKTTILVAGESGAGKEVIARAIHLASPRRDRPLICLNCAAISETLLESELFGHEKGAFTGAHERKIGKFEAAHLGTLFLDEIGEMSPALQAKFLRVLEGHPFERVGGTRPVSVDVRVIAATNRDLEREVSSGRFRRDLFFRLRVLEILVPPLRSRRGDVVILSDYFLDRFCRETGRRYTGFTPEARRALESHLWPGNVRELKNVVERAVVVGTQPLITEHDLLLSTLDMPPSMMSGHESGPLMNAEQTLDDVEKIHITHVLHAVGWNKSLASKKLGIERTTLDRKIRRYQIEKE